MHFFSKKNIIAYLGLLLLVIIIYLPISSFTFSLKNDAFHDNFPNKYFFSECIQNGVLPTWNPYLNFGYPLYADPGFAWWSPITWLFGLIGYNAYTFTIELLLYIYIGAVGMLELGKSLKYNNKLSFILATVFIGSGFYIGNLQHINFITSIAFFPFVIRYWFCYQKTFSKNHLLFLTLSIYMLCAGGHPAIPIGSLFILITISVSYYFIVKPNLKKYLQAQFYFVIASIILLSPIIWSYFQIINVYARTETVLQSNETNLGFTLPSFISFVFPFSTINADGIYNTDVSMRNSYISLIGIIVFVFTLLRKNKTKIQKIFIISLFISLLLSLGGSFKELFYSNTPLLSFIRTNGQFRVFIIFSILLIVAEYVNAFSIDLRKVCKVFLITSFICLLFCTLIFLFTNLGNNFSGISLTEKIKYFIDNATLLQTIFVSSMVTGIFSLSYYLVLSRNTKFIIHIVITDILLNAWLLLPVTGFGKASTKQVQNVINTFPKGFNAEQIKDNYKKEILSEQELSLLGNTSWYDKKINHEAIKYPSRFKSTLAFYNSSDTALIKDYSLAFLKTDSSATIDIIEYKPNKFKLKLNTPKADTVVILQNNFKGWNIIKNNSESVIPITVYKTFIGIPVAENDSIIELKIKMF